MAVEIPAKLLIANASSADNGGAAAAATIDVAEKMNMMIEQMGAMQKEMDGMKAENAALKDQIAELGVGGASGNPVTDTVVRLSCEGLGEAPSGFKCPTKVHPDSMVIIDVDGLRALKFTSAIQGPLTIHNIAAGFDLTEYIQNLEHVAGDITVENNAGLKTARFSALVRVDGSITFQGNPAATTLEFPLLDIKNTTVSDDGDTLVVSGNTKLEAVVINDFTHLYGKVNIDSNPLLESFLLPALTTVEAGAALTMKSNSMLESVSFPAMTTCADFTFTSTPANSTVSLPLLEVITGTMVITIKGGRVNLPLLSNAASGGLEGKLKLVSSSQTEDGAMRVSWPVEVQNLFASNPNFVNAFGPYAIKWVVQKDGVYRISTRGAAGQGILGLFYPTGYPTQLGGRGAVITISHELKRGDVLDLAPGAHKELNPSRNTNSAGGGGTFVALNGRDTPLVVAGAGASANTQESSSTRSMVNGVDATLSQDGVSGAKGSYHPWGTAGHDQSSFVANEAGKDGSDGISCYPACNKRDMTAATGGGLQKYICAGCIHPARGYVSFVACGYCAAESQSGGSTCDVGGYLTDCSHPGNGYSGGGGEYSKDKNLKGGGGSYYQHPDSTVLSTSVENTGFGSILIEAL